MNIPSLWALELSPKVNSLLRDLRERALPTTEPLGTGYASATLRDALLLGLNAIARQAGLAELDVAGEREPLGTHVSPVVTDLPR
jgi:hypothetical protein